MFLDNANQNNEFVIHWVAHEDDLHCIKISPSSNECYLVFLKRISNIPILANSLYTNRK